MEKEKLNKLVYRWPSNTYVGTKEIEIDVNDCQKGLIRVEITITSEKIEDLLEKVRKAIELLNEGVSIIKERVEKVKSYAYIVCTDIDLLRFEELVRQALQKAGIEAMIEVSWYKPEDPEDDP